MSSIASVVFLEKEIMQAPSLLDLVSNKIFSLDTLNEIDLNQIDSIVVRKLNELNIKSSSICQRCLAPPCEKCHVIQKTKDFLNDKIPKEIKNLSANFNLKKSQTDSRSFASNKLFGRIKLTDTEIKFNKLAVGPEDVFLNNNTAPNSSKVFKPSTRAPISATLNNNLESTKPLEKKIILNRLNSLAEVPSNNNTVSQNESDEKFLMAPLSVQEKKLTRPVISNPINWTEADQWIKAHEAETVQKAVKLLIEKISHISHEKFTIALYKMVQQLNPLISQENDYWVVIDQLKSQGWVYSLSKQFLDRLPAAEASLDFISTVKKMATPYFPKKIVLFDDAMFSGKQMSDVIKKIANNINVYLKQQGTQLQESQPMFSFPEFIVACPYATEAGVKRVTQLASLSLKIRVLSYENIPTVRSSIQEKSVRDTLTKMYRSISRNQSEESFHSFDSNDSFLDLGVIYFDHKIPDSFSFPKPIANGLIYSKEGKELMTARSFNIMNKVPKPYGRNE